MAPSPLLRAFTAGLLAAAAAACASDLDCSLNGVCSTLSALSRSTPSTSTPTTGTCACDPPWTGPSCSRLAYAATTPKAAFDIYNESDPHNTWGGPVVGPGSEDGKYHAFVPLYEVGSLFKVLSMQHGLADSVTGPWTWTAMNLSQIGINPAFLAYPDPTTGATVYSLWVDGVVHVSSSLYGPFAVVKNFSYPSVNPAPIYHQGTFYMTNQHTLQILTSPTVAPGAVWEVYSNITSALPTPAPYHIEDPFLYVDSRENWHVLNHAYSLDQFSSCAESNVSSHFFSTDGKEWHWSDQPYTHTVTYDDGTSHIFATLERPNVHFDMATGKMTHIVFAADLDTGDEGCGPTTACDNCKWKAKDGTTVVALAMA
jgi:hypothetical protein